MSIDNNYNYNNMKISNKIIAKLQEGGSMPAEQAGAGAGVAPGQEAGAAPEEGGGDPIMQIEQLSRQALETQDCQAALAVCEAFVSLVQGAGGAPAEAAPAGQPVFAKGGKLVRFK